MKRPIILTASLICGVCTAITAKEILIVPFLALFICLAVIFIAYKSLHKYVIIVVLALLLVINFALILNKKVLPCEKIENTKTTITGIVTESVYYDEYILYYTKIIKSEFPDIIGRKVCLSSSNHSLAEGMEVVADVKISALNSDKKASFYSDNVYLTGSIVKLHTINISCSLTAGFSRLRANIRTIIFANLPYDIATTINGLTIGDRSYEDNIYYAAVKRCGVSHILVVSGLHMAVVCGSVHKLLKLIKCPPLINVTITFAVTLSFMALCGFTPSVLRAGVMFIIMLVGLLLRKSPDALNSLSVAFKGMVILNPYLICNVGFLLSVTSTAGIIVLNPLILKLIRIDKWKFKPLKAVCELAVVTISAQTATLPICLYYFGSISPYSVLVNILISFSVTVALIVAFLGIIIYMMPLFRPLAKIPFICCSFMTAYFNNVIMFFGKL